MRPRLTTQFLSLRTGTYGGDAWCLLNFRKNRGRKRVTPTISLSDDRGNCWAHSPRALPVSPWHLRTLTRIEPDCGFLFYCRNGSDIPAPTSTSERSRRHEQGVFRCAPSHRWVSRTNHGNENCTLMWRRTVAPALDLRENTRDGLALSRPRRGFESRWGHQLIWVEVFC